MVDLVRSLGADHVVDYTKEDFTRGEQRYDVILDNVMNHPPSATARVLSPTGLLIPNRLGNSGRVARGPTKDGAGDPHGAGLHPRAVRDL
jgi:NADPH:quinone reductase-like Zn-dependent oxidoreductase